MVRLHFGFRPKSQFSILPHIAAVVLALATGACSTAQSGSSAADVPTSSVARADMEADGMEAQAPPLKRTRQEADDPSEPFSPNYGPPPMPIPKEQAAIPHDLPHDFRKRLASALSD